MYESKTQLAKIEANNAEGFWECDECGDGLCTTSPQILLNDDKVICANCLIEAALQDFIERNRPKVLCNNLKRTDQNESFQ